MDLCIEILEEQINAMKENYYCLIGACTNLFEFSSYTVFNKEKTDNSQKYELLYKKIKVLREKMLQLRDDIANL